MRSWQIILVTCIIALVVLFYQGLWGDPRAIPTVLIGTLAPPINGPDLESDELVASSQYDGKVRLINFWASWCLECRIEHPNLLTINERFGGHPDFVMLGINYQDRKSEALKYLDVHGNNFRHIVDLKGAISIDYGVYGVPETFVIDRDGVIRFKYVGPLTGPIYSTLTENILRPLLEGRPIPAA